MLSRRLLHDVEAVAVGIVEAEHGRHVVPAQQVADVDSALPHGCMFRGRTGNGEAYAGVDIAPIFADASAALRAIEVLAPGGATSTHRIASADRGVESLLEAERVDEEGECLVLVRDSDPNRAYIGDGGRRACESPRVFVEFSALAVHQ